jgi:TolB-like protein/Flp pilus assembly protein TadD
MSLYSELKRRNVFRVAIAYLAAAWLLTEVAGTLFPAVGIPDWGVRFIVIVFALGFIPTLVFSWVYELTPEGVKREKVVVREESITHLTAKRLDIFTIGVVVVALAFILADRLWFSPRVAVQLEAPAAVVTEAVQTPEPAPPYPPNSIAVLPFVNMSDDAGNEYFSDGISEELLNLLAKIPELRVISRSSAFYFKGKDVKLADVARELKVAHILEGSVRKAGNQVRITAQLIDTRSDTHLWSESYDRTLDDIFAIQDEIAAAVVDALKLTLLGDAPKVEQVNPEAYELYLQAAYMGSRHTAEAYEHSNKLYQQALAIDPNYAAAWKGLSGNYYNQVNFGLLPTDEGLALSVEAINRALTIDPEDAHALDMLGWHAIAYGDLAAGALHLEYALSLEPTNLQIIYSASTLLLRLGRLEETIAIREYVVALDPLNPRNHAALGHSYRSAGRLDEAIASYRTVLMLSPGSISMWKNIGSSLLLKGENEAALKAIQQEPSEALRLTGLVMAYHALGQEAESDAALAELIDKYEQEWAFNIAYVLAFRGEADRAFAWLGKAVQYQDKDLTFIVSEPLFANIHYDPRWLPFLEGIGMSPAQLDAIEFEVTLPE